jgi:hypothetical protein
MTEVEATLGFGDSELLSVGVERKQRFTEFFRGCERTQKATLSRLRAPLLFAQSIAAGRAAEALLSQGGMTTPYRPSHRFESDAFTGGGE